MQLLLKFKSWLRHWLSADIHPQMSGRPTTIEDGAAQLVERARMGDQNAIALICQVRDNAKKGVPRAKAGMSALVKYIQANPVVSQNTMGEEIENEVEANQLARKVCNACFEGDYVEVVREVVPDLASQSVPKAIVAIANGPSLLERDESTHILDVYKTLSKPEKAMFKNGFRHGISEMARIPGSLKCAFLLGHIFGTAHAIQAVRLPRVPVSVLSPQTGFELGE